MARITVDEIDLIMLASFKRMRQICKSDASKKHKEIALNDVFSRANKMIDIAEGKEK